MLVVGGDADGVARQDVGLDDLVGEVVLDVALDGAAQRTGAVLLVPALGDDEVLGLLVHLHLEAHLADAREEAAQFDVDDLVDLLAAERIEVDDVVDAVEELGSEGLLEALLDHVALQLALLGFAGGGVEAYAHAEVLQLAAADVGGHDDDGVLEVHLAADAVGEHAVVEHLQQHVEDVGVSFLHLVEQHDGVGLAAHALGELAALLVAHVARRGTDEAADGELLHVLAHVDADHGALAVEEVLGEDLGEVGLADARGAEEEETADGAVGVLQTGAVAADGLGDASDGLVLSHHAALQLALHGQQASLLALGDALHRHAGHHGHHGGHILCRHRHVAFALVVLPAALEVGQLGLQVATLVAQFGGLAVALLGQHLLLLRLHARQLLLQRHHLRRHLHIVDAHPRTRLVHGVDGLVGLQAVAHVALRQVHAGLQRLVAVLHRVVLLVLVADVHQDFHRLLGRGGLDEHLLEAAFEGRVLLDILAVLVQRRGADALDRAACQGGFEHVAGVEAASGAAGAHDGVYLVDEDDDLRMLLQLGEDGLHALLELAAVLRACHQAGQVEAQQALAVERARHLSRGDLHGQSFGQGALAHAAFADQHGVVLLAAAQDLRHALQLALAAHDGVQLALLRHLGQVAAEVVQRRRAALVFLALLPAAHGGVGPHRVGEGLVVVVLAGLAAEVGQGAVLLLRIAAHHAREALVVHPGLLQQVRHQIVVLLQHGQNQMFGAYLFGFYLDAFEVGEAQHLLRLPQHGNLAVGVVAYVAVGVAHLLLQPLLQVLCVDPQGCQHVQSAAFAHTHHAEVEMLHADGSILQSYGFLLAEVHRVTHVFAQICFHCLLDFNSECKITTIMPAAISVPSFLINTSVLTFRTPGCPCIRQASSLHLLCILSASSLLETDILRGRTGRGVEKVFGKVGIGFGSVKNFVYFCFLQPRMRLCIIY